MSDIAVSKQDLSMLRRVLESCLIHLEATDVANAEVNLQPVRYRPLTNEVAKSVERIEGILAVALLEEHKAEEGITPVREMSAPLLADEEAEEAAEEPEQLQLFNPDSYEAHPAVKQHRGRYRMLADE